MSGEAVAILVISVLGVIIVGLLFTVGWLLDELNEIREKLL
jgi:hypothetical protein